LIKKRYKLKNSDCRCAQSDEEFLRGKMLSPLNASTNLASRASI